MSLCHINVCLITIFCLFTSVLLTWGLNNVHNTSHLSGTLLAICEVILACKRDIRRVHVVFLSHSGMYMTGIFLKKGQDRFVPRFYSFQFVIKLIIHWPFILLQSPSWIPYLQQQYPIKGFISLTGPKSCPARHEVSLSARLSLAFYKLKNYSKRL